MIGARTEWVFDLDNTLYPASSTVFPEMDRRMTDFVAGFLSVPKSEALALQKRYYAEHGATLKGMMANHDMDPAAFLFHVHEVDLSDLPRCQRLRAGISRLPGRKFVYTNGTRRHAERVTRHMGLDHLFDGVTGIEDSGYAPKPEQASYDSFCERHGVEPARAVFFEDLSRNLAPAHAMGFATVLVTAVDGTSHAPAPVRPAAGEDDAAAHIHYVTDDLAGFLAGLTFKTEDAPCPTPSPA